jgi:ABC-2 type transport system permease protein
MRKFLAVVKREYVQRVRTKFFVVATVLGPVMMAAFAILPPLMSSIKAGGPTRLAIIDQTGKMYERVARELTRDSKPNKSSTPEIPTQPPVARNPKEQVDQAGKLFQRSFLVEEVPIDNRSLDQIRNQLDSRIQQKDLDGYIVLQPNLLKDEQPEFRARNTADLLTQNYVQDSISRAVRGQRLVEAGIKETDVEKASEPVKLKTTGAGGAESNGQASAFFVFGIDLLIYMSVLLYGQLVLGAVIEEKETRIAEILFSSMRSFPLMMGKLVGVSLVALTQLGLWAVAFLIFSLWAAGGSSITPPHVPRMLVAYFALYFLMGYFIYATVYAVVGSMVTTTQEGGQLALPVVLMLVAGFYLTFSITRSPNSSLAFWASMFPFFAPITMMARIVTETPPMWQIVLSFGIGVATIVGLVWLASRIYRVGMLMYGKKATIPEVWRWIWQS